ncbi:MAG TPA: AAA family ATPase [Solirubrobacter sp.]
MSPRPSEHGLVGRSGELARMRAFLDTVGERGNALVLCGEPGIGKSVLLDAARAAARERGFRILITAGVETESGLPYAGLHRLLQPLLGELDALPAPQREMLRTAFGLSEGDGGDLFLAGLGTLGLLATEASRQALLVVVDDLHWLDAASREVIAFVGRRIEADPIVLIAATRDHPDVDLGLPKQPLEGLDAEAARALLDRSAPGLDAPLRQRILREAAGNPLALAELPVTVDQLNASLEGPMVPISARLEQAFAHRLREAGPETRSLLLILAADVTSPLATVLAAGERLLGRPITVAALQPVLDAELVSLDGSGLRFRHPLVRSAIYQAAPLQLRHTAHAALAELLADQPDRRAQHRAAAAVGPDESVARDLEQMGLRALRRGAALQASAAFARAAELSVDPDGRVRRLLAAAEPAFEAGRADLVKTLVEQARRLPLHPRDQGRVEWLSEIFHDGAGPGQGDASRVLNLIDLARRAESDSDREGATALLMAAALRAWWGNSEAWVRRRVAEAVDALDDPATDPRLVAALAMAEPITGATRVSGLVAEADATGRVDPRSVHLLGLASHAIGDCDAALRLLTIASDGLREQGRLALLAQALVMRSVDSIIVGDWAAGHPAAFEAARLADETGQPIWHSGATGSLAALAALHGDVAAAERLAAKALAISKAAATTAVLGWLYIVRAIIAQTAGRYDEAYDVVERIFDPCDPSHHLSDQFLGVTFLADAAVGCGRVDEARAIIEGLERLAGSERELRMRWGVLYARALLADDARADAEFTAALAAPWSARPFTRARLQLAYGMWLRRRRRVVESREPLRIARSGFDALDAPAWGERARQELRAAGEASDARRRQAWDDLSPQELQIVQLAASGLSNREIGQRLYLSHRTVASHLYRAFPKLGITSRSQLNGVLPAQP